MGDVFKFPNGGHEVAICRKQDILDTIYENITDREVALAIIEQCEKDAINFLKEDKWVSIPFIGNIRVPKNKVMEQSEEQQALIQEARLNLNKDAYVLFRKQLRVENKINIKNTRYHNYVTSIIANKNRKLFKRLCKEKGDLFARIYMFTLSSVTLPNIEEYGEE